MQCVHRCLKVGVDYYKQINFIRYWSTKHSTHPLSAMESLMCSAASMAVVYNEDTTPSSRKYRLRNAACIICLTESGYPAQLIAKYRPPAVIFCVSDNEQTVRQVPLQGGYIAQDLSRLLLRRAWLSSLRVACVRCTFKDGSNVADSMTSGCRRMHTLACMASRSTRST
jgi:hypothetical protein